MLQTLRFEHIDVPHEAHIGFFTGVKNAYKLREELLAGNDEFQYAFIDASSIVSVAHVLAAVHQAVHRLLVSEKLRTRNVHSETVFSLSPTNNITEAFRRFGVAADSKTVLCIKISFPGHIIQADTVKKHIEESVDGEMIEFSEASISQHTDWSRVKKYYKLQSALPTAEGKGSVQDIETEILGKMMMRIVG